MQVRFLGFNFSIDSKSLTLDDYVNNMIGRHGQSYKLSEHDRFLYFNSTYSENYYVGLLVTVKDQKTFCELVRNSGKLVVRVNELDENTNLMDFNFFIINKVTGLGVYQYYHQSCSLNSFGHFNNRRFSEFNDYMIETEIAETPQQLRTPAKEKSIKFKYRGKLSWEILVRSENLKNLIQEFQRELHFQSIQLHLNHSP